jgi:hypothetical protein
MARTGNGNRRSFDYGSRDRTARTSAQDHKFGADLQIASVYDIVNLLTIIVKMVSGLESGRESKEGGVVHGSGEELNASAERRADVFAGERDCG